MPDKYIEELMNDFFEEAFSLVDNLEKNLLTLEQDNTDMNAINSIFRVAHTIKGNAGTVGFEEIQSLTHVMEDVLDLVRNKQHTLQSDDISLLLDVRDELETELIARQNNEIADSKMGDLLKESLHKILNNDSKEDVKEIASTQKEDSKKIVEKDTSSFENLKISSADFDTLKKDSLSQNVLYCVFKLDEENPMKDVAPIQLTVLLRDLGDVLFNYPDIEFFDKDFVNYIYFFLKIDQPIDDTFIEMVKDKTNLDDLVLKNTIALLEEKDLNEIEKQVIPSPESESKVSTVDQKEKTVDDKKEENTKLEKTNTENTKKEEKRENISLRIDSSKIDHLLNLLGELVITRADIFQSTQNISDNLSLTKDILKDFLHENLQLNLIADETLNKEQNHLLRNKLQTIVANFDSLNEQVQKLNNVSSSLQENVMNMRMIPVKTVFARFPRLIRDLSKKLNKQIDLKIEGLDTDIDKGMVDDLFDPLVHILRNSIDHGIESIEERKRLGKPEKGTIILRSTHQGNSILIEVMDDGQGINIEKVKQKAIQKQLLTIEEAAIATEKEIVSLVFMPGFSTESVVSDLSGRGVGMDVVKTNIEDMGGTVEISTVSGKGTTISIHLPLTLAIIQGLLIKVKSMHYIIPVASVEETVIVDSSTLQNINGFLTYAFRDELIPIVSLNHFFYNDQVDFENAKAKEQKEFNIEEIINDASLERFRENEKEATTRIATQNTKYCILVVYNNKKIGLLVDHVLGEQDVVVKPLDGKLIKSPGISSATIIGNGNIGYILDATQLIEYYFSDNHKI